MRLVGFLRYMEGKKVLTSASPLEYPNFSTVEGEFPVIWLASGEGAEESSNLSWGAPKWGSSTVFAAISRRHNEPSYANEVFDSTENKEI